MIILFIILPIILAVLVYFLLKRRKLSGPLTLKKESWHVRLHGWLYPGESLPKNICEYFWKIAFPVLISLLLGVLSLMAILASPIILGAWVLGFTNYEQAFDSGLTPRNLWLSGAGLIFIITSVIWTISANMNTEFAKIIKSFIQAKKDKTCIEIQWKDSVDPDEIE